MAYKKLIVNITNSINDMMEQISTRYNFDLGDELEIGICELLSELLPQQYTVCRGFAVTGDDDSAGDDILIYARDRFPTIRPMRKQDFSRKQEIPIEAVYAYIEVKHTIFMDDATHPQGLNKAISQVSKVKNLPRAERSLLAVDPYTILQIRGEAIRPHWPGFLNPLFGMVLARQVKATPKTLWEPHVGEAITFELNQSEQFPDLLILGKDYLVVPTVKVSDQNRYESPFFLEGISRPVLRKPPGGALATGLISLLYALDTIRLDKMPYSAMLGEQLGIVHSLP